MPAAAMRMMIPALASATRRADWLDNRLSIIYSPAIARQSPCVLIRERTHLASLLPQRYPSYTERIQAVANRDELRRHEERGDDLHALDRAHDQAQRFPLTGRTAQASMTGVSALAWVERGRAAGPAASGAAKRRRRPRPVAA